MAITKPEATCRICSKPIMYIDHKNCYSVIRALKSLRTISRNAKVKLNQEILNEYLEEVLKYG